MASASPPEVVFVTNKPRLRSHNKSRGGCSTCKARKVKCPENRPTCRTCARRGEICVYADRFRGLNPNVRQDYTKEASEWKTPAGFEDDEQSNSDEYSAKDRVPHKTGDQSSPASLRDLIHTSTPKQLNWNDEDDLQVINSCTFYNSVVVIHIAPAHAPFQRIEIPVDVWRYFLPKALQHLWIALMKIMQATRAGVDPLTVKEVCQYRGSGLRELTKALPDVANDPYGMVLGSVMTMMTAELYIGGPWTSHLEAARRILILKGGFKACFEGTPTLRRLLFNYIVGDVYSATMCNSQLISEACSEMHADYVEVLDDNDQDVFACSRPCPRQLMQAIVRVNMLRASRGRGDADEHIDFERQALSAIITTFEPASWAISASDYGRILPQRPEDCLAERDVTALSSYASCYHSATQLYFLLSCATPLNYQDRLRTHIASQSLSQHLRSLFKSATNDSEGPLHSQLWKLLSWPILVGMYVRAGWDIGEEDVQTHLGRLRKIAKVFRSTRTFDAAKLVRRVGDQRARCADADWKWDDGFYSRSAFAL